MEQDKSENTLQPCLPAPTPCQKHCGIDESLLCSGCMRTGRQIGAWLVMGDEEKWDILGKLPRPRRAKK